MTKTEYQRFYEYCIMGEFRWDVFKPWMLRKKVMHVAMATEKRTLTIELNIFLEIMLNELFM